MIGLCEYISKAHPAHKTTRYGKALTKIYFRNVPKVYRAVRGWMKLMEEAILYGVDQQMIRGKKPLLEPITKYNYTPTSNIELELIKRRADEMFNRLIQKAPSPASLITTRLVDWDCIRGEGDKRFGTSSVRVYSEAMDKAGQLARAATSFEVINTRAVAWAAKNVGKRITLITNETMKGIRNLISQGIKVGDSTYTIGRNIRPLIGLNQPQMTAYQNLKNRLVDEGIPKAKMNKTLERYTKRAKIYRAEMIARTETAEALTAGTLEGYDEAGVRRVRFEASADACEICSFLDGNKYTILEAEGIITGATHPNCRCTFVPILGSRKKKKP